MSSLDLPPEFRHLPLRWAAPPGVMIHRKYRWVAQLFKQRKEIKRAQFIKVHGLPDNQPCPLSCVLQSVPGGEAAQLQLKTDLEHFFDWGFDCWIQKSTGWTVDDLKNFDELILTLFDGCGYLMQRWTIGDITFKPFWHGVNHNEAMSEDDYDVYEVKFNCCLHNYENFCPPITPEVMNLMEPWNVTDNDRSRNSST